MKYNLILSLAVVVFYSCQTNPKQTEDQPLRSFPEEVSKVFEAHGGYDQWTEMSALSYAMENGEKQLISLKDRKVLIEGEERTIGFDGNEVWVQPDTADASRARFYHNLYFYFYAMPFVLGDSGISYEQLEPKEMQEEVLSGIKVSYGEAVGDSPDDNYILWYDPSTYQMKWLMYTVTYGKDGASDRYSLIKYPEWTEVNGLKLPKKLQWHVYKNDSIGDVRGEALFTDVLINKEVPNAQLFEMPEDAQVAPGPEE